MTHAGPGRNYPNVWLYQRRDLPVRVVKKYENWRLIQDPDGAQGWMLVTLLSDRRTAIVKPGYPRRSAPIRMTAPRCAYMSSTGRRPHQQMRATAGAASRSATAPAISRCRISGVSATMRSSINTKGARNETRSRISNRSPRLDHAAPLAVAPRGRAFPRAAHGSALPFSARSGSATCSTSSGQLGFRDRRQACPTGSKDRPVRRSRISAAS